MTLGPVLSDAVSGSPSFSAGQWRLAYSGLYVSSGALTVRSGALSIDSFAASIAGTTVSIGAGRGVVQGATSGTQGAYPVYSSATVTQVLNAASAQDRIDLIYLWLQDNEVDASGAVQATFVYLPGTPSGSPVAPTIPAGRSGFAICTAYVPASGSPTVTQAGVMPYTAATGGIIPALTDGQPGSPENGQVRWRADRSLTVQPGPLEIWDTSAWHPIVPDSYPRGRMAYKKITSAGANSGSSTPVVYNTLTTTLTSGRRYRLWASGNITDSVTGLRAALGLYYIAGASMPAGAVGATNVITVTQVADGAQPYQVADEFVSPGGGTYTLALTYNLSSGSGIVAIPGGANVLWLDDIGV
ncbi:hypothetical protein KGA66_06010 [Actinocrinis puniceicyclus]|uniref:Uncharacterized protein n=1 Tax=Actinocrinis puniceicyclus TaxID=977794 RepID=A0A8J7WI06_9ACTN|nr:hypothetical protein [Actinocrinis puniceicyclus]MBS2962593.1 hypothetical protein [Actinocrinis puniceicyclus]